MRRRVLGWRGRLTETTSFKYRAFLSYSHRDKAWGKWLHTALERYAVDKELIGRETPLGPILKTLRPNLPRPRRFCRRTIA